jgi:hypothetical protein
MGEARRRKARGEYPTAPETPEERRARQRAEYGPALTRTSRFVIRERRPPVRRRIPVPPMPEPKDAAKTEAE